MNRLIKILTLIVLSIMYFGFDNHNAIIEIMKKCTAINDSIDNTISHLRNIIINQLILCKT